MNKKKSGFFLYIKCGIDYEINHSKVISPEPSFFPFFLSTFVKVQQIYKNKFQNNKNNSKITSQLLAGVLESRSSHIF